MYLIAKAAHACPNWLLDHIKTLMKQDLSATMTGYLVFGTPAHKYVFPSTVVDTGGGGPLERSVRLGSTAGGDVVLIK